MDLNVFCVAHLFATTVFSHLHSYIVHLLSLFFPRGLNPLLLLPPFYRSAFLMCVLLHRNSPSFRSFEEKVENTVSTIKVSAAYHLVRSVEVGKAQISNIHERHHDFLNHFVKKCSECWTAAGSILLKVPKLWLKETKRWDLYVIASLLFGATWIQLQSWKHFLLFGNVLHCFSPSFRKLAFICSNLKC